MRLAVQYTEEDLLEAQKHGSIDPKKRVAQRGNGFLGLTIFAGLLSLLIFLSYPRLKNYLRTNSATAEPSQDFLVVLLPGVVPALSVYLVLLAVLIWQAQILKKKAAFASQRTYRLIGWMTVFIFILIGLVISAVVLTVRRAPVIEWHPSRGMAVLVGLLPWVIFLFMLGPIIKLSQWNNARTGWIQQPSLHRPRTLELTPERVSSFEAKCTIHFAWDLFERFRETEKMFLLVTEDSRLVMVPKRYLSDPEMIMELRALLQTNIKEGHFLKPLAGAFEVLPPPPLVKM